MKLCVFPNDPLKVYLDKGEIKSRYFNPKNMFDEVHIISLFDSDAKEEDVKQVAGNAKLKIHVMGKVNLSNYKKIEPKLIEIVKEIKPDLIRSYNPLIQGWLAAQAAKKLKIPYVISLHTNYDQQRKLHKIQNGILQFIKSNYLWKKLEKFSIKNADAVICVYEYIVPYAKKNGARKLFTIYNKIDLNKFSINCKKKIENSRPTIISVGRLIDQKDHSYILEAIKDLNVNLIIIGDGPNYSKFQNYIKENNLKDKVKMIKKIPNSELPGYYRSCQIYVQPLKNLNGIPIPVLEAMACGLPIIMSKHEESYSEIIDSSVIYVENHSEKFKHAIQSLLNDENFMNEMRMKSQKIIKKISGDLMDKKEIELYDELIKSKNTK